MGGRLTLCYCVYRDGDKYWPVPIDRKRVNLDSSAAEHLEKIHPNTTQTYFVEKQHTRRRKYARQGSNLQKVQAGLYVALAGGLLFLLFIIFSEVTGGNA